MYYKTYIIKYLLGHRILLTLSTGRRHPVRLTFCHEKSFTHFTALLRKVKKHTTIVATKLQEMKFVMECGPYLFCSQDNSKDIKERRFGAKEEMSSSCLRDLFTISIMSNKRKIRACFQNPLLHFIARLSAQNVFHFRIHTTNVCVYVCIHVVVS